VIFEGAKRVDCGGPPSDPAQLRDIERICEQEARERRKKRVFFIALLLLSSGPAYAELVAVAQSANTVTIYIDTETISRNGRG
jgi:hypothetical protein